MEELEWEVLTSCLVGGREGKLTHNTYRQLFHFKQAKYIYVYATCQLGSI